MAENDEKSPHHRRWWWTVGGIVILVIVFAALVWLGVIPLGDWWHEAQAWWMTVVRWWQGDGWPWVSTWLTTPGFGGFAAVVAASLAFSGARHQARLNSWWQRAEWALNLYTKPGAEDMERRAGAAGVAALQRSRLAKRDEKSFLAEVAKAVTLDPYGDGADEDDWAAAESAEPATEPDADVASAPSAEPEGPPEPLPTMEDKTTGGR